METSVDNLISEPNTPAERPSFLKVICILTWVCCAFTFLGTAVGVVFQKSPEEQMADVEKMREKFPEMAAKMEDAIAAQPEGNSKAINTGITLIALGFSAFGASMMWQLKKKGIYVYIVGELLPYLSFLFVGAESMSGLGAMGGLSSSAVMGITIGIMALLDGIFIAMYAANLKHMKS